MFHHNSGDLPPRGLTPAEVARLLRIGPDRVRALIRDGQLGAVDLGTNGRTRLIVLPVHLAAFLDANAALPLAKPKRKKARRAEVIDFFPGD